MPTLSSLRKSLRFARRRGIGLLNRVLLPDARIRREVLVHGKSLSPRSNYASALLDFQEAASCCPHRIPEPFYHLGFADLATETRDAVDSPDSGSATLS